MVRGRHVRAASGSPTPAPAQRPQPRGAAAIPQAYWTRSDSDTMIKFLLEEKSKAGDGGNFPASFWTAVSALLNPLVTRGGPKTAKVCSNKYGQFRTTYKIVKKVVDNSGWRWDDVNGAGIDETTKSSWDDYVKAHPKAKPYRNKGWPYRAAMAELMPSTVSGAHVFRPSHAAPAAATANDNDRDGEQAADIDGEVDGNADGDADGDGDEDEEMQDHNKRTGSPDWDFSNFTQSSSQNSGADHSQDSTDGIVMQRLPPVNDLFTDSAPLTKKHTPIATPGPSRGTGKRPRLSAGPTAITQLAASVTDVSDSIRSALAPPDRGGLEATPRRKQKAILRAQQLEGSWLNDDQLVAFISLLETDVNAVDAYTVLQVEALRKKWISRKLGLIDFNFDMSFDY